MKRVSFVIASILFASSVQAAPPRTLAITDVETKVAQTNAVAMETTIHFIWSTHLTPVSRLHVYDIPVVQRLPDTDTYLVASNASSIAKSTKFSHSIIREFDAVKGEVLAEWQIERSVGSTDAGSVLTPGSARSMLASNNGIIWFNSTSEDGKRYFESLDWRNQKYITKHALADNIFVVPLAIIGSDCLATELTWNRNSIPASFHSRLLLFSSTGKIDELKGVLRKDESVSASASKPNTLALLLSSDNIVRLDFDNKGGIVERSRMPIEKCHDCSRDLVFFGYRGSGETLTLGYRPSKGEPIQIVSYANDGKEDRRVPFPIDGWGPKDNELSFIGSIGENFYAVDVNEKIFIYTSDFAPLKKSPPLRMIYGVE